MRMKQVVIRAQDRVARLMGLDPAQRPSIVRGMLHPPSGDATGYWLQLLISVVLATLGLALNSTAVVIGAMLIAPFMRPIVELAMGLATGSPPLAFRTGQRAVASIALSVGASAAFTAMLPFHDPTPELVARMAPTLLDLAVAAACAVAGAYAVIVSNNSVATTAAGTSIGISLVPPLCTAGYGLSVGDWEMATGAGLLFTANITGIITVASAVFVIVGFGQSNIGELERAVDDDERFGTAARFGFAVASQSRRLGLVSRLVLPLLLLGAIGYPLLEAVNEMTQRTAIRQRVATILERSAGDRVMEYSLDLRARPIELRVVLVGDPAVARGLEATLRGELAALGKPSARVAVWAVPDATAVSALSARLDEVPRMLAPPPEPEPEPPPPLEARIRTAWPAEHGGELLAVWTTDGPPPQARITHLGPELGSAGRELLVKAVTVDVTPELVEETLVEVAPPVVDSAAWVDDALVLLERASHHPRVHVCVTAPPPPRRRPRVPPADTRLREALEKLAAAGASAGASANVVVVEGTSWRLVPQTSPCPVAPETPR